MTIVKAMRPWLLTAIGMPTMAMTNAINSTELMTVSDDNMSNDDDDAERDLNDHNDKYDDDDDDDAEQVLIGGDDPVCKSCGNFGHRSHRDHKCPNHHCAVRIDGTAQHLPGRGSINGAFMHGHCNVALSRVRNRESLAILVDETNLVTDPTTGKRAARTTNIVCRKILDV
jgi:hypothetical protein